MIAGAVEAEKKEAVPSDGTGTRDAFLFENTMCMLAV